MKRLHEVNGALAIIYINSHHLNILYIFLLVNLVPFRIIRVFHTSIVSSIENIVTEQDKRNVVLNLTVFCTPHLSVRKF